MSWGCTGIGVGCRNASRGRFQPEVGRRRGDIGNGASNVWSGHVPRIPAELQKCKSARQPHGSHIAASDADALWDGDGAIGDTSPRRERRTGRAWDDRRSRRFCNELYFRELLGADTVSSGNALLPPIGSPGNGSVGTSCSMLRRLRRPCVGRSGRAAVGGNRSWKARVMGVCDASAESAWPVGSATDCTSEGGSEDA